MAVFQAKRSARIVNAKSKRGHVSKLETVVNEIVAEMRDMPQRGEVASYIPELARVDPKAFGLVVIDAEGKVAATGDAARRISSRHWRRSG